MLKHVKLVELPVVDQDRAVSFYTERLGLRVAQDNPYQSGWRWVELEIPSAQTRIFLSKREDKGRAGVPSLILIADNVTATYEDLKRKGVNFTKPPTEAPWNKGQIFALFEDGEGNTIMLGSQ